MDVFKRCFTVGLVALAVGLLFPWPAQAVDEIEFFCNGGSGPTCDIFQLDGNELAITRADTCVGTENGCPNEENPSWPADWDALLFPSLTNPPQHHHPDSGWGTGSRNLHPTLGRLWSVQRHL